MHVDLSFSYLRFAEAASFDKKTYAEAAHYLMKALIDLDPRFESKSIYSNI